MTEDLREQRERRRLLRRLRWAAKSRASVCVLAPMFTPENESDGYLRRIRSIDETVLAGKKRIYLMGDRPDLREEEVRRIDRRHWFVEFDSADAGQRARVTELVSASRMLYVHSVYRFMAGPVAPELRELLELPGLVCVWDVHGAVPEECELNGDPGIAAVAAAVEERLFRRADVILCVSRAMERHLREKYGEPAGAMILLPIAAGAAEEPEQPRPCPDGKPAVIYSGGLQSWQNVPDMLDLISETADRYAYRLYVPDKEALRAAWGDRPGWDALSVASCAPEEMGAVYRRGHYGLLLREDIAVNRVACPTKLVEYIRYGLVPVLRSPRVGDFTELGMEYVAEADLRAGHLPPEAEREKMARKNLEVLARLDALREEGIKAVHDRLR